MKMMYNIFYDQAPSYLCQFKRPESIHFYETRGSIMSYVIPKIKMKSEKTFMYNWAKLGNSLDVSTRSIQCKDRLKTSVKNIFFAQ